MATSSSTPLLQAKGITKSFGVNRVLHEVDLECRAGEIQALLGANGAGKSTLIQIITGVYHPDDGTLWMDGQQVTLRRPIDAQRAGISAVYQELSLVDELDVAQNILLHKEPRRGWFLDERRLYDECRRILDELEIGMLDPRSVVGSLSVARRQIVELAKALAADARVVILDEPTASLTAAEQDRLFELLGELRERGLAIIYVTHRLDEVFRLADRVTILRDGRLVSSVPVTATTRQQIISDMVGEELADGAMLVRRQAEPVSAHETPILTVESLSSPGKFAEVSFDVRRGEIVGIAGLIGSGRSSLLKALFGRIPWSGRITLDGKEIRPRSVRDAVRLGIAMVTDDRKRTGLAVTLPILKNLTSVCLPSSKGVVRTNRIKALAREVARRVSLNYDVRLETRLLSGGNQQKVAVGKWVGSAPRVLLCDEPTRGIDVGARAEIYSVLRALADGGVAIVVASSDLEEVLALSDKIVVMHRGRAVAHMTGHDATEEALMAAAFGGGHQEASRNGGGHDAARPVESSSTAP